LETVTIITGIYPVAFVGRQPVIKNVIVVLIRFRNRLPLAETLRPGLRRNRLPLFTAPFGHCDKRGGQIVGRGPVSNNPPFVVDAISYIQGNESSLREIFRKLV
jgi:hypothetical protein